MDESNTPTPEKQPTASSVAVAKARSRLNRWAIGGTALYAILTVIYLLCLSPKPLHVLEPNEIGDFLAGFFAPLAFLWLVVGYRQQGIELKMNGEALLMQAQQLELSNEEFRAQVEELKKAAEHAAKLAETSKEDIEMRKAQHLEEREERRRAAYKQRLTAADERSRKLQPFFLCSFERQAGSDHNRVNFQMTVINTGELCVLRNVEIQKMSGGHLEFVPFDFEQPLFTGHRFSVLGSAEHTATAELLFVYNDQDGFERRRTLHFNVTSGHPKAIPDLLEQPHLHATNI